MKLRLSIEELRAITTGPAPTDDVAPFYVVTPESWGAKRCSGAGSRCGRCGLCEIEGRIAREVAISWSAREGGPRLSRDLDPDTRPRWSDADSAVAALFAFRDRSPLASAQGGMLERAALEVETPTTPASRDPKIATLLDVAHVAAAWDALPGVPPWCPDERRARAIYEALVAGVPVAPSTSKRKRAKVADDGRRQVKTGEIAQAVGLGVQQVILIGSALRARMTVELAARGLVPMPGRTSPIYYDAFTRREALRGRRA